MLNVTPGYAHYWFTMSYYWVTLITHNSSLITHNSSLTTHNSQLITHHSQLTSHYSFLSLFVRPTFSHTIQHLVVRRSSHCVLPIPKNHPIGSSFSRILEFLKKHSFKEIRDCLLHTGYTPVTRNYPVFNLLNSKSEIKIPKSEIFSLSPSRSHTISQSLRLLLPSNKQPATSNFFFILLITHLFSFWNHLEQLERLDE